MNTPHLSPPPQTGERVGLRGIRFSRGEKMEKRIKIKAGSVEAEAVLNDSATAQKIWDGLPLEARANTWGDEIYFAIPVKTPLEKNAQELVEVGDLGYWPSGNAFCIFFGPTPMSRGNEVRPASAVNVIGRVSGDARVFQKVPSGSKIRIEGAKE
jgi:hypothetical protein